MNSTLKKIAIATRKLLKILLTIVLYICGGLIGKTLFGVLLFFVIIAGVLITALIGVLFIPLNNYLLFIIAGVCFLIFIFLLVRQDIFKDRRIKGYHLIIPWILVLSSLWAIAHKMN